jgi:homoserine kinase type II
MQLNQETLQEIASRYDFVLNDFEPIQGGAAHSSYLLYTNRGNFVLTIFSFGIDRVRRLGQLLVMLGERQFPTTRLVPSITEELVITHMKKPVILKEYIKGVVCQDLSRTMLGKIGETMAKLHKFPVPDYLPDEHAYGLQYFSSLIGRNVNLDYEPWLANQLNYLKKHILPELPRGLIHGDIFYDNVLIEGEKFRAIIDFEEACHYYKVFDLGMGILGLCVNGTILNIEKARVLIEGYQRIRILEEKERVSLQLFVEYAAIATSSWRFWKYHIDTPTPEKADMHRQMVQIVNKVNSIPKVDFLGAVFG